MKEAIRFVAALSAVALALTSASPANAEVDYKSAVTKALTAVSTNSDHPGIGLLSRLAELQPMLSGQEFVSKRGGYSLVVIPANPANQVKVSSGDGTTVLIGMPFASQAKLGSMITDGAVAYDNQNESSTAVLAKEDGSLQIATVLASRKAPARYTYRLTLPAGAKANIGADGGVNFSGANGKYIGGIAPAWSRDARGAEVPTHYELSGSNLTQIVDHQAIDYAYPIVADPWLGLELIDRTAWQSKTLQVFPTLWGRLADTASRWAAWDEVISKTPGNKENTPSMRDQLYCHVDFVRKVDPFKTSWNLDLDRPYVDYFTLFLNKCNTPR